MKAALESAGALALPFFAFFAEVEVALGLSADCVFCRETAGLGSAVTGGVFVTLRPASTCVLEEERCGCLVDGGAKGVKGSW